MHSNQSVVLKHCVCEFMRNVSVDQALDSNMKNTVTLSKIKFIVRGAGSEVCHQGFAQFFTGPVGWEHDELWCWCEEQAQQRVQVVWAAAVRGLCTASSGNEIAHTQLLHWF